MFNKWRALLILLILTSHGLLAQNTPLPPRPPGTPMPGQMPPNQGLESHQIYLAYSDDGLNWQTDNKLIRAKSSVPALAIWRDEIWIIAVNGAADDDFEKLVVLHQLADGTWEEQFIEHDLPGRPVDPELLVLPDGRLRLYVFDFTVQAGPPPPNGKRGEGMIYSATSDDGIHFTMDEGIRLTVDEPGTDPDVIQQAEDVWWMYVSHPDASEMVVASSADGMTFEAVGLVSDGAIADTVRLDDGTLRQYVCTRQGMHIRESSDGLIWQNVENVNTPRGACDPDVERLPDGSWIMVYKAFAPKVP